MEKVTVHLTREERQVLYSMTAAGRKDSEIAKVLGRHRSTVCRERKRKKPRVEVWSAMTPLERASYMQEQAVFNRTNWKRGSRRGQDRGPVQEKIRHLIEDGRRSPEQAAKMLAQSDEPLKMSGQTIRRYVDEDARELKEFFPLRGKKRRKQEAKTDNGMRQYDELPFAAATRMRMGDFEVDLIVCSQNTESILSVRERLSRRVFLRKVPNRKAETVRQALFLLFGALPAVFRRTALFDRDKAFSQLLALEKYYGMEHYACDAYCSWQKGAVENANAQVRRFIPSGTDLSTITPERLAEIERWINITPMPVLGDLSPIQAWEYELKCFRDSLH